MPFRDGYAGKTELGGDIEIINEAGPFAPSFGRRGASSRGKQRTSIEIVSEPLLFDLDELALGAGPAEAIRARLEKDTKNITEVASAATLAKRKSAAENPTARSTQRRYSGGRTGFKAPNQSVRLFNDSGRLAEGFFVRENKQDTTWTVNVPANRLTPEGFVGDGFQRMLDKFRSLMPVLQDARALLSDSDFNAAVSKAAREMITKGELAGDAMAVQKLKQLAAARKRAVLALVRAGRMIFGG